MALQAPRKRPITVELGTNVLGGTKKGLILEAYRGNRESRNKGYSLPPKWDGKASQRIWKVLLKCKSQ